MRARRRAKAPSVRLRMRRSEGPVAGMEFWAVGELGVGSVLAELELGVGDF